MKININTISALDKTAHSLETYQQAYDLGSNAGHSSENPFDDDNLICAFIAGYEENMIIELMEDDYYG